MFCSPYCVNCVSAFLLSCAHLNFITLLVGAPSYPPSHTRTVIYLRGRRCCTCINTYTLTYNRYLININLYLWKTFCIKIKQSFIFMSFTTIKIANNMIIKEYNILQCKTFNVLFIDFILRRKTHRLDFFFPPYKPAFINHECELCINTLVYKGGMTNLFTSVCQFFPNYFI